jgi:hypothetical protein
MRHLLTLLTVLLLAAASAEARGGGRGGFSRGGAARGGVSRGGFRASNPRGFASRAAAGRVRASAARSPRASFGTAARGVSSRSRATFGTARRAAAAADAPPPNFSKPGALIRTEGQLPVYSDPGNARTHSVEGGGFIAQDAGAARDAARSPGVTFGTPDGAPASTSAGGNGATANGPAFDPSF